MQGRGNAIIKTHDYIDTDGFQGHNWVFFADCSYN